MTYETELHVTPMEAMVRLARECSRSIVGAWRGSNTETVEAFAELTSWRVWSGGKG